MYRTLALALALSLPAYAGYEASSTKRDARFGENAFALANALDSKLDTAWQCDPEKDNIGQWLEIDVPTATIDRIALVTGWDKDEKTFKDYARIKAATVEVFAKGVGKDRKLLTETKVSFDDARGWQLKDLQDVKIEGDLGGTVRVTVTEVYAGVDFPNLAISELRVDLKEFPADSLVLLEDPPAGNPKNEAPLMLDKKDATYFIAQDKTLTMKMKAPGYGLSSVGLLAGPATHARPKVVVVKANNNEARHEIAEGAKGMQWLLLPVVMGYTGAAWGDVEVEIVESWPGSVAANPLAIAELRMNAGTIEEF